MKIHHQDYSCLPSGKLTWQWKILVLCGKYIFQWSISYCYVRLPECRSGITILVDPSFSNPGAEKFRHPQIAKVHGIRSIESWKCSLIGVIHLNILRSSWLGRFHLTSKRCLWTLDEASIIGYQASGTQISVPSTSVASTARKVTSVTLPRGGHRVGTGRMGAPRWRPTNVPLTGNPPQKSPFCSGYCLWLKKSPRCFSRYLVTGWFHPEIELGYI